MTKSVVTPETEEAGLWVLSASGIADDHQEADKLLAAEISRAMFACKPQAICQQTSDQSTD